MFLVDWKINKMDFQLLRRCFLVPAELISLPELNVQPHRSKEGLKSLVQLI